ncbi:MAG TPA: MBL fold metallo-hydrolase [Polyangiaceae bacterium]|nr:MBL fold metallo-hydrolase [Polyangiaceae bacterium]
MHCVLRLFVLGSGSSGNCLVVEGDGERLVVDAGLGPVRAVERMRALGTDLFTGRSPLALLVTHDHADHSSHALSLARALRTPIFAHDGVAIDRARRRTEVRPYAPNGSSSVGPFRVDSLCVPHDAPQVALRISVGARSVGIATDLGHAPRALCTFLAQCDLVLLEANHCPEMLATGPYPIRLQRRIGGPLGHLANHQTAGVAVALEDTRVSRLVLLHLSRANNTPQRALDVVGSRIRRLAVEVLPHGEARRWEVGAATGDRCAEQLAFAF